MTELYELPTPAAGRVGICRAAIEDALQMGFSMNDCAVRLALNYKTFWQAFRENKIVVPAERQLPLPAPAAVKQGQSVGGGFRPAHSSSSNGPTETTEAELKPKKTLARIGQKAVDSEDDGLTAAQRVLANIPRIGE